MAKVINKGKNLKKNQEIIDEDDDNPEFNEDNENNHFRQMSIEEILEDIFKQQIELGVSEANQEIKIAIYVANGSRGKRRVLLNNNTTYSLHSSVFNDANFDILQMIVDNLSDTDAGQEVEAHIHFRSVTPPVKSSKREKICIPDRQRGSAIDLNGIVRERERKVKELETDLKDITTKYNEVNLKYMIEKNNCENLRMQLNNPQGISMKDILEITKGGKKDDDKALFMEAIKSQYELRITGLESEKRDLKSEIDKLKDKVEALQEENTDLKIDNSKLESSTGSDGNMWGPILEKLTDHIGPHIPQMLSALGDSAKTKQPAALPDKKNTPDAGVSAEKTEDAKNEAALIEMLNSLKDCFDAGMNFDETKRSIDSLYPGVIDNQVKPALAKNKAGLIKHLCDFAMQKCAYNENDIKKLENFINGI